MRSDHDNRASTQNSVLLNQETANLLSLYCSHSLFELKISHIFPHVYWCGTLSFTPREKQVERACAQ
jgi:hypothetical protein